MGCARGRAQQSPAGLSPTIPIGIRPGGFSKFLRFPPCLPNPNPARSDRLRGCIHWALLRHDLHASARGHRRFLRHQEPRRELWLRLHRIWRRRRAGFTLRRLFARPPWFVRDRLHHLRRDARRRRRAGVRNTGSERSGFPGRLTGASRSSLSHPPEVVVPLPRLEGQRHGFASFGRERTAGRQRFRASSLPGNDRIERQSSSGRQAMRKTK